MARNKKILIKRLLGVFLAGFIFINIVAAFHAYRFTHFSTSDSKKTNSPEKLSFLSKLTVLAFGIDNPRPGNSSKPAYSFETINLQSNKRIECWYVHNNSSANNSSAKGTVILFHGYSGEKSTLLFKSDQFLKLGYNTLLVDFMGSGGSEGNQTTLGFKEAYEVKTAFDYLTRKGETNIYLFGSSMGAVAILKAIHDLHLTPRAIIIECPFGSMYQTTCARFKLMNAPAFPMAGLLMFWGGLENGFWAFGHNPITYAKKVNCATLLLYGAQDKNVSRQEINDIYHNLNGPKLLKIYSLAGHEDYLIKYSNEWIKDVKEFLSANNGS